MLRRIARDGRTGSVAFERRLWKTVRAQVLAYDTGVLGYPPAKLLERQFRLRAVVR